MCHPARTLRHDVAPVETRRRNEASSCHGGSLVWFHVHTGSGTATDAQDSTPPRHGRKVTEFLAGDEIWLSKINLLLSGVLPHGTHATRTPPTIVLLSASWSTTSGWLVRRKINNYQR